MSNLDSAAEEVKLERVLNVAEGSLEFIAEQTSINTRAFREELTEFFYKRHQDAFGRLAGMNKLLPLSVSAKLALNLLGPVLSAGIASELAPDKAAKLSDKLPTDFLAKVSLYLDPRRAGPIISAISEDHIVSVAGMLNAQKEYVTLARFVTCISKNALSRIITNTGNDGESLLKTGMYVEDKGQIDGLLRGLSEDQRQALFDAANEHDLESEMISLITSLKPDMQEVMANLAAQQPDDSRNKLIRRVQKQNAWSALVVAIAAMDQQALARTAALSVLEGSKVIAALEAEADAQGVKDKLAPLLGQ